MSGILYVVATPIGNSGDITQRAQNILQAVDIIAAEDTRTTQVLLRMLNIRNKMVSNHKFNEKQQVDFLLNELAGGRDVAVVSDAGTPCISDPGSIIVDAAARRNIPVIGICGPSAVITALSVSGYNFDSFAFYGFLPKKAHDLKDKLQKVKAMTIPAAVFFESPRRIIKTMQIITEILPGADLCVCNDLTKMHERIYRGKPAAVWEQLQNNPNAGKGEYTLVVKLPPAAPDPAAAGQVPSLESLLVDYMVKDNGTLKEALSALAGQHKGTIAKKEFYTAALNLKQLFAGDE